MESGKRTGGGQIVNPQPPPHFLPLLDHIRREVLLSVCCVLVLMLVRVSAVAGILNAVIDAFIVAPLSQRFIVFC